MKEEERNGRTKKNVEKNRRIPVQAGIIKVFSVRILARGIIIKVLEGGG